MVHKIKDLSLWKEYKENDDLQARQQLILNNISLVKYQAGRIKMVIPDFIEQKDLESYGVVGLIDAIEKFDYSRGIKFNTYASKRIRGTILDYLRDLDWLPSSLRREGKKIKKTAKNLANKLGRKPTVEELSNNMNIAKEKIENIYQKLYSANWISLYGQVGDNKILDFIKGDNNSPEKEFQEQESVKMLSEAIKKLPEKEKLIIALYYYEELTQKEIASVMELSTARISQLHKKAVQRLRGFLSRKKEEISMI